MVDKDQAFCVVFDQDWALATEERIGAYDRGEIGETSASSVFDKISSL